MATALSDSRHPQLNRDWSLGAVLAELEIDEHTCLVLIRADVALARRSHSSGGCSHFD